MAKYKDDPEMVSTIDFSRIQNDRYWVFGRQSCYVVGGRPNLEAAKHLKDDLEQIEYYLAMAQFDCEDVTFNIRLMSSKAEWIFEADGYQPTEEDFKALVKTEFFQKFLNKAIGVLKGAFVVLPYYLQKAYVKDLDASGASKADISRAINGKERYLTIAVAAAKNPKMKAMPK